MFEEPLVALASGCDPSAAAEEPPVPLAPPPEASVTPVVQVRIYSWRSYARHDAYDKRGEFVGTNKQINTNSLLFSQQEPLVSRVRLMKVVRKIGQQERSRGRSLTVDKFNEHFSNGGKDVTSSSHSNRKDGENMTYTDSGNLGIGKYSYKYPDIDDKYNSKDTGKQEKEQEREFRLPGLPNAKGMVTSLISDVTIREQDGELSINKLVTRQYEKTRDCLRSYTEKGCRKVARIYNKVVAIISFYFIIVTRVLKGIMYPRRCERKSTVGNSKEVSGSESVRDCKGDSLYTILECLSDIWEYKHRLWLLLIIYGLWRRYKVYRRKDKGIWNFINTLTLRLVVARPWLRNLLLGNVLETLSLRIDNASNTFLAGKYIIAYICQYLDLWASCRIYLYICTIILELCDKFKRFYAHIYLYICKFFRLRLSCKWASYPLTFAIKLYTLVYFSSKASLLMIKSHKKYQGIDLIGLALGEKAYAKNRSFWNRNRSYWRELRPLVTPWTWPIKEGTEPWKGQIGFSCLMSKVSLLPLSLSLLSFSCSSSCCSFIIIYYVYVHVKGNNSDRY